MTGSLGGAERILLTLLSELRRMRPNLRLTVICGDTGPLLEAVRDAGCDAEVLLMPPPLQTLGDWGGVSLKKLAQAIPAVLRYRAALRRRLRQLAPNIVQTNGFKMHLLGAFAYPQKARLIWHIHDFVSSRRAMKTLLRWCANKPAGVVAISPTVAKDFACVRSAQTIWNAVDLQRFSPTASRVHLEMRIGMVATFAKWKGQDVFLQALALLPEGLPWRAFVVGGELYKRSASQWTEPDLRALARQLNLEPRVEFLGFLRDPSPLVQTLDIVVHASIEPEPFGLVIAEAMAAGRAVVTTSDTIVTNAVDGLVCKRNDPADMARAIAQLAQDPKLRAQLAKAAIETANARFRPERMAEEFLALYEAAL